MATFFSDESLSSAALIAGVAFTWLCIDCQGFVRGLGGHDGVDHFELDLYVLVVFLELL